MKRGVHLYSTFFTPSFLSKIWSNSHSNLLELLLKFGCYYYTLIVLLLYNYGFLSSKFTQSWSIVSSIFSLNLNSIQTLFFISSFYNWGIISRLFPLITPNLHNEKGSAPLFNLFHSIIFIKNLIKFTLKFTWTFVEIWMLLLYFNSFITI